MKTDQEKLDELLRIKWRALLDQKLAIQKLMGAIDLMLDGTADEEQEKLRALDAADDAALVGDAPPKKKRGRRTNAQIAADKLAAELDATASGIGKVAEITDEDERANAADKEAEEKQKALDAEIESQLNELKAEEAAQ